MFSFPVTVNPKPEVEMVVETLQPEPQIVPSSNPP